MSSFAFNGGNVWLLPAKDTVFQRGWDAELLFSWENTVWAEAGQVPPYGEITFVTVQLLSDGSHT